jgi:hypothetical protein
LFPIQINSVSSEKLYLTIHATIRRDLSSTSFQNEVFEKLEDFNFMHFDHHADKHPLNEKNEERFQLQPHNSSRCATLRKRRFVLVNFGKRWKLPAIIFIVGIQ